MPEYALEERGDWLFPTFIRFGAGRIAELASELDRMHLRSPLLVTDRGLTRTGIPQRVAALAAECSATVRVHDSVGENPTDQDVLAGVEAFHAHGGDCVIALGGGSGLDCGKTIALMAGCGGTLDRFLWPQAATLDEATHIPIIAIPTTAGTGAEVEASSVITITSRREKAPILNPSLLPKLVIADPDLTMTLPPGLTAATGMDALSHNLEALFVPSFHPMADAIAATGARLCLEWLPTAVENGNHRRARLSMMVAALMGATAFGKGLGAMHALSHAIGGLFSTQHGVTNAVLMPHVLNFNRPVIETRISSLAAACGMEPSFDAFLSHILLLSEQIGIPKSLGELGVSRDAFEAIIERAERDVCASTNPRPLDHQALSSLLEAASA